MEFNSQNSSVLEAYFRLPVPIVRGDGVHLFDAEGKQYLDFASGIAVTSMGHNNKALNDALQQQASHLWHCSNIFTIPEQERLAKRLCENSFADRTFFCSSGLEAIEACIKIIRKYQYDNKNPSCYRIITLDGGFHGRSMAALSAGGNNKAREGFGPLLEGFDHVPRNDLSALEAAITEHTAGILLEPVQSEGGVFALDKDYLKGVRALADKHNLVLCFDEVQTGYGRTGFLFAHQRFGVEPDMMALAKGMGNGFPLAACLMRETIAGAITPGTHGSTYGGNPLAMAVGNAVLDAVSEPGLLEKSREISSYLFHQLQQLQQKHPSSIAEVRGVGMLVGLALNVSARKVMVKCIENGLAVTKAGGDEVLRLLPPIIIDEGHVDEAIEILDKVLSEKE